MTVIFIGPHPDDPEEGSGGTICRMANLKERIIVIYVTSGGKGIGGMSAAEVIKIRTQEAKNACKLINAEPIFLGLEDGAAFPTEKAVKELINIFEKEEPKAIFTCWPLDTHPDHRATSYIVTEAYGRTFGHNFNSTMRDPFDLTGNSESDPLKFPGLFYWSTEVGHQSVAFHPNVFVDITPYIDQKMELVEAHQSQNRNDSLVHWVESDAKHFAKLSGGRIQFAEGFMTPRPLYI